MYVLVGRLVHTAELLSHCETYKMIERDAILMSNLCGFLSD